MLSGALGFLLVFKRFLSVVIERPVEALDALVADDPEFLAHGGEKVLVVRDDEDAAAFQNTRRDLSCEFSKCFPKIDPSRRFDDARDDQKRRGRRKPRFICAQNAVEQFKKLGAGGWSRVCVCVCVRKTLRAAASASMASRSRWFVGSSRTMMCGLAYASACAYE